MSLNAVTTVTPVEHIITPTIQPNSTVETLFFVLHTRTPRGFHQVNRLRVIETGRPTHIVGGEVVKREFTYAVARWHDAAGWVKVIDLSDREVDGTEHAARVAQNILTAEHTTEA